jgi:DNA-directed RNA polymerase subunit M/transcription elongation factor TFIIS
VNFCPECGALLKVANKSAPALKCPKCKYNKPIQQEEAKQKTNIHQGQPGEIAVIDKKEEATLRPNPTINVLCPKCGKNQSETWTVAVGGETTRSTLTFFRCTTCGTTRRETG